MKLCSETGSSARRSLRTFAQNDAGATAIEYALIAGGIGLAIAVTVPGVGAALNDFFTGLAGSF